MFIIHNLFWCVARPRSVLTRVLGMHTVQKPTSYCGGAQRPTWPKAKQGGTFRAMNKNVVTPLLETKLSASFGARETTPHHLKRGPQDDLTLRHSLNVPLVASGRINPSPMPPARSCERRGEEAVCYHCARHHTRK